jgi:hypothetical protein
LMGFVVLDQPPIKGLQPGITAADGNEGGHPQSLAKSPITNRSKRRALWSALGRLILFRTKANIGSQCAGALEASGIAEFGDQAGRRIVADPGRWWLEADQSHVDALAASISCCANSAPTW